MKVNEIIYEAMKRLDIDEDYDKDYLEPNMPVVSKLLFSVNNVLTELTEICGFKTIDRIEIKDGKIFYSQLQKEAYKVIGAKINGVKVTVKEKDLYIAIDGSGMCDVEYYYRIKPTSLDEEIALPPNISVVNVALGIAADYCLNVSRLDEAAAFEKKYKSAIYNALGLKRTVYVPVRNKW